MSVILDALQKARTDRKKNQVEPHPNSIARVLEPLDGSAVDGPMPGSSAPRRNWVLPVTIVLGMICFLTMAGGAFFLLYDQVRSLQAPEPRAMPTASVVPPQPSATSTDALPEAAAVLSAPVLPPPQPLPDMPAAVPAARADAAAGEADLPVVPPSSAVPAIAISQAPAAAVPTAAPAAQFKLGSIVCEGTDCIANLNGRTVRLGDKVRQYQVVEITASSLTLQGAAPGDTIQLSLFD